MGPILGDVNPNLSEAQFAYGRHLTSRKAVVAHEDALESAGAMGHSDDRHTCSTCKTWATEEHVASNSHWERVGVFGKR